MRARQIVIAGGGLAGLTLAQCLKARNIPSIVLHNCSEIGHNAYGIDLQPWAYLPLLKDLHIDLADFRRLFDVKNQLIGATIQVNDNDSGGDSIRCHRGLFQHWLAQGLDIRCGHEVEKVKLQPLTISVRVDDKVKDMPADILVAADGAHSQIRKTLSSNLYLQNELKILPYVVFNGRRPMLRDETKASALPHVPVEPFRRLQKGQTSLSVELNAFGTGNRSVMNYTYSRPVKINSSDCLYMPSRSPSEAKNGPGKYWNEFEHELRQLQDLPLPFRDLFDPRKMRGDRVLNWLMRSALVPLQSLRSFAEHNVLFIGDAAHTMPILGGEGANLAIKDAVDLAKKIMLEETDYGEFFDERYNDWTCHVQKSEQRLADMHSTKGAML